MKNTKIVVNTKSKSYPIKIIALYEKY